MENGDAFVHHAFMSRDVEHPWWYSVKGVVMRNRHLDVKGLYSHSYASEVYKSRTQVVTFLEVGLIRAFFRGRRNGIPGTC